MGKSEKGILSPEQMVVYCSSVWGGSSWVLADCENQDQMTRLCGDMEEDLEPSFHACTLRELLSCKSGNDDVDEHWRSFLSAIRDGEYEDREQFQGVNPAVLKPAALLRGSNEDLLLELLEEFFDTGYSNDGVADYLRQRDVDVVMHS